MQSYRLQTTLQVSDEAGHNRTTTLLVTVTDINDNPPCFPTTTITTYSVEEDRAVFPDPMSNVGRVQAMDLDLPNNPQITYFISSGDNGQFNINPQTGNIFVIRELNREAILFYTLNITSTDGNLTCGIQVFITVLEVNDNDPVFLQNPYLGSVVENAAVGTTVDVNFTSTGVGLQVVATDIDRDPVITYTVLPQSGPFVGFSVDLVSGYIITNDTFDREAVEKFAFLVQAHDGLRSSNTLVEIVILDFNDQPPVFVRNFINITVPELTPANFVFLFVEATDDDVEANAEIVYSLSSVDPPSALNLFNISETRGGMFANEEVVLNNGDPTVITITVTASNLRSSLPINFPVPFDTASVIVYIEPQNVNAPQFTSPHYTFTVIENQNASVIGNVTATEMSGDVGTVITYNIVSSGGSDFLNFIINSTDGFIFNVNPFDREDINLYQFSVTAMDNAPIPRFGFTSINVRVLDDNDNAPVFRFPSYPVTVSEAITPNTIFLTVFASDADIGSNAQLMYSIVEGNTTAFAIDSNTGDLRTLLELDREVIEFYPLTLNAIDGGSPPMSTNVSVLVTVGDVNDNDPIFTSGTVLRSDPIEVSENSLPPLTFTTLEANDIDANGNAHVVYTFEGFATTSGPFQINRNTGQVTLRSGTDGSLDRERQDIYDVIVMASDQGGLGPEIRSTPGSFSVRILDVNDSVPTFTFPLFEFEVIEDYPLDTVFGAVSGTDADIEPNDILFYHVVGSNITNTTCSEEFCVNHMTGELSLNDILDRETQPVRTFTLAINNQRELQYDGSTSNLIAATTTTVRIEVLDANDVAPVFIQESLFAAVEEDANFGTFVTGLKATDVDTGNGSVIWFSVETPDAPFVVDRDTGEVTTAGIFKEQSGTTIDIEVRAFDNFGMPPTENTIAILSVLVFKCEEQLELSFQRPKEVIEAGIDRIKSVLVEVTGARIIISDINVRQTPAGTVDVTGTDVKFFALDPTARKVLNPSAIARVIDGNFGVVDTVFEEFGLTTIMIEPCEVAAVADITINTLPDWFWVVIGILVLALLCLCCCCLLVCIGEKRKSRKWKNKAARADYQSQLDQFSQHQMTDMSMFAQENPMWVDPYPYDYDSTTDVSGKSATERENPLYESQELTIDMFQETAGSSDDEKDEEVDAGDKVYESQEILLEMFSDNMSDGDSHTHLIKAPARDMASPLKMDPYDYDSTTDVSGRSTTERKNSLLESQELEVDAGDQMYESQEILLEMFSDNMSDGDSHTHLIKAPARDMASPLNQDAEYLLERALDDFDEESDTSFI